MVKKTEERGAVQQWICVVEGVGQECRGNAPLVQGKLRTELWFMVESAQRGQAPGTHQQENEESGGKLQ